MLDREIRNAKDEDTCIENLTFEDETVICADGAKVDFDGVKFINCTFKECDFEGASFYNTTFEHCNFANNNFARGYFSKIKIIGCNGDGASFYNCLFKETNITLSTFCYANLKESVWDNSLAQDCTFIEAFFSEVKLKKTKLYKSNFSRADFFKTLLKGMDMSENNIHGITLSETYKELKGATVNITQAVELAQLLGVKVVG